MIKKYFKNLNIIRLINRSIINIKKKKNLLYGSLFIMIKFQFYIFFSFILSTI